MKGFWKKVLPAAVFATAFSTYGCNAGGAKTKMSNYDESGFSVGNKVYEEKINSLEVDWQFGNAEVIETDGEISVTEKNDLPEKNKLRSKIENGVLKIMFWQSGLEDSLDNASDKNVVIKIPEKLNEIRIVTLSASVSAEKLSAKTLEIKTTSGAADLGKITAETVDVGSVSGGLRADEVRADRTVKFAATSAKTEVKKVEGDEVELGSVSGEISLPGTVTCKKLKAESTSGAIKIGTVRATTIELTSVSGKIKAELNECEKCVMETTSGNLELSLGLGAEVNFSSNGKFLGEGGNNRLYGDGKCKIFAESVSGNLSVSYSE